MSVAITRTHDRIMGARPVRIGRQSGLRRHTNQHNLIGFVTAVLCDFLGLYILVRLWPALVAPRVQPPSEPTFSKSPHSRE
jgi:hypothetical protein